MDAWNAAGLGLDFIARESAMFAAAGFVVGGLDDLAIDLVFILRTVRRRLPGRGEPRRLTLDRFPVRADARRMAVFVAAWDEARVIGAMLDNALRCFDYPDYHIYVGTYPNDRATIDAVARVAAGNHRVRLVIGDGDGPTTKADCLNAVWRALRRDEEAGAARTAAIVLHDAEDAVHGGELRVFDVLLDRHCVVQLPVLPLVDRGSRLVSGHYCDEFAEAHAKQLVVREALGAAIPLAGVGCAISRQALDEIAAARGGAPFDAESLTEDYELGLQIGASGRRGTFARIRERPGGPIVAVRAYFPATLDAAVRQKARWMIGIALAGWDRIGWSRALDWREHWMRMRDRRAPLAVIVLAAAYLALVSWGIAQGMHAIAGIPAPALPRALVFLLSINVWLLAWRLAARALFSGLAYGPVEAALSLPRAFVGNLVSLLAARRAVTRYVAMLRGAAPHWEKTDHAFPDMPDTEAA